MKKVTILLSVLLFFSVTNGQKVYFVYLQSENEQPFYTRLGDKIYNSSSAGYLILSKLRDSTYIMNIGVQGSQSPEKLFSITVDKKDQGYLIKDFGEKGWGLFNLQSFAVMMTAPTDAMAVVKTEKRESNAFTDLLAKAADDSTLKERPVIEKVEKKKTEESVQLQEKKAEPKNETRDTINIKKEEIKKTEIPVEKKEELKKETRDSVNLKADDIKKAEILIEKKTEPKNESRDTVIVKSNEIKRPNAPVEKKDETKTEIKSIEQVKAEDKVTRLPEQHIEKKTEETAKISEYKKTTVIKHSESSTTEGFGLTFLDVFPDGNADTIKIFIPGEKQKPAAQDVKKVEKKFLDFNSADSVAVKSDIVLNEKIVKEELNKKADTLAQTIHKANACLQVATTDDFFKLRKDMAAEISDDNMINEAKKNFKDRCFTTEQIKNLSTLFLTDEGKYKFFDAGYSYISDKENFGSLQSELKDPYFINRFKAMLRQ